MSEQQNNNTQLGERQGSSETNTVNRNNNDEQNVISYIQNENQNQNNNHQNVNLTNEQNDMIPQQYQEQPPQQIARSQNFSYRSMMSTIAANTFNERRQIDKWFEEIDEETQQYRKECCDVCCLYVGKHSFCCSSTKTEKDYMNFGIGINLYYRFLKQIGCYFLIFTILSIPQIFFSVISYIASDYKDQDDKFQFLMATTIGSTSLNNRDCQIQTYNSSDLYQEFSLQCETGDISGSSFYYGVINSNEKDCVFINQKELNQNTTNQDTQTELRSEMDSQQSYKFNLWNNQKYFSEDLVGKRVFAGIVCKNSLIKLGAIEIEQKIIPIIFASCDALTVLIYIFFLISLSTSENKYLSIVQIEQPVIQNFSLQISHLPKGEEFRKKYVQNTQGGTQIYLIKEVQKFINHHLQQTTGLQDNQIYDIQASEQKKNLEILEKIKKQKIELEDLLGQLERGRTAQFIECKSEMNIQNFTKETYIQFFEAFKRKCENLANQNDLDGINNNILSKWDEIDKSTQQLNNLENENDVKYIWVTFDNINQKKKLQHELQSLPIDWCQYSCCFCCLNKNDKKKLLFDKYKLSLKEAPNPENINWMNLNYTQKNRMFRQCLSFIITIAILIGSFVFISYINDLKKSFQEKYPSINCQNSIYLSVTFDLAQNEMDGNSQVTGYVECYCKPKFNDLMNGNISQADQDLCSDWLENYLFQQGLPWAMVAGLIIVNIIIQYIFIFLSSFECHLMISEEYAARIFKIFLAQFLNTGLILLISNIDFGNSAKNNVPSALKFLFGGKYGDIDAQWCQNVGIVLLLTLLVNIAISPVMLLIEMIVRYAKQAIDQCSCCLERKKTKKQNKSDFRELYLGQIFRVDLRYAQILNALFVCFMYSAALPFLYFTTLLTIAFLYWVDKISLFKTYRKPVMIDQVLNVIIRKYLWAAIIIHLGFATYIYGSTNLFYESFDSASVLTQLENAYDTKNVIIDWWDRSISQLPNLILLCILVLIVLTFILLIFCYKPTISLFSYCFACCNKQIRKNKRNLSYTQLIDDIEQKQFLSYLNKNELEEDLQFTISQTETIQDVYGYKQMKLNEKLKLQLQNNQVGIEVGKIPLNQSVYVQQPYLSQIQNQNQNQSQINNSIIGMRQSQIRQSNKLIGLRSYHLSYNPTYQKYYDWDRIRQIQIE